MSCVNEHDMMFTTIGIGWVLAIIEHGSTLLDKSHLHLSEVIFSNPLSGTCRTMYLFTPMMRYLLTRNDPGSANERVTHPIEYI